MTINYLKIAYRNLLRNKVYTLINLLGLSIGLASVILITIYVNYETSYDESFEGSDWIYRAALDRKYTDRVKKFAASPVMLAPTLKEHSPQVEEVTRLEPSKTQLTLEKTNEVFTEGRFFFADSAFFKVFSYEFIIGDSETALNSINAVVLTESTARRYFGTINVLDQVLNVDEGPLQVTGVIKDTPANAHFHFDLLASIFSRSSFNRSVSQDNWAGIPIYTYIKLKEGASLKALEAEIPDLVDTYSQANMASILGSDWKEKGNSYDYSLQPLTSIHLHSKRDREIEPNSDVVYVYIISIVAIIILTISTINFINLSVARSTERAKEVGIRKVMGSYRSALVVQFLTESVLVSFISCIFALGIVLATIPKFNSVLGTYLQFQSILHPTALFVLLSFVLLVGIISGLYPAVYISGLKVGTVIKGNFKHSSRGTWLRNSLIIIQFVISVFMISGSIIVTKQMHYLVSKDLGFNQNNLLIIHNADALGDRYSAFYNSVTDVRGIESVSKTLSVPGDFFYGTPVSTADLSVEDVRISMNYTDEHFIETMGLQMLEGRGFQKDFNNSLSIVLNEAAVKILDIKDPIGKKLSVRAMYDDELTIVGVVKDFNYYSLHSEITPLALYYGGETYNPASLMVRLNSGEVEEVMDNLSSTWSQFSSLPLDYSFLDKDLERLYEADQASSYIFDIFTIVAIIMSCTGLFGLAIYLVNQKSKEMSIRKVLGASMTQIVMVFSKYFLTLISISFLISAPIAYIVLVKWLNGFAFHINVDIVPFALSGFITLFLVFIIVSYLGVKLAMVNPAKILKCD